MRDKTIGIIGGGQLGMLLLQKALEFPVSVMVLDPDPDCSAAKFTDNFVCGDFQDYQTVVDFGLCCEAVTFEIEKVNLNALKELKNRGVRVVDPPEVLDWIQDKGIQREMLAKFGFAQPRFELVEGNKVSEYCEKLIRENKFPVVQKLRKDGYDGKGVMILDSKEDLENAPKVDSVFEEKVDLKMEISVLVARRKLSENHDSSKNSEVSEDEIAVYDPIEMIFEPKANLVEYLVSPARISKEILEKAKNLGAKIARDLDFEGILAIELFLTRKENSNSPNSTDPSKNEEYELLVNEISPRPHNSGHHTVSANKTSQYEQQIRALLDLPLGSPEMISPSVLVNLLGDPKSSKGKTHYHNLEKAYKIANVQYTFYGKREIRPYRKMGHAVILEENLDEALKKAKEIKETLKISTN